KQMKIEKLRKNNSKKYFLCGLISVVILTITVTFIGSKANYRMTASIPLTEGKVVSSPYDINIVALYLDNVEQDSNTIIPNGYKINEDMSYCYKGTNKNNKDDNAKLYTDELGNHSFSGISKSSKCVLYLEKAIASNYHNMQDLLDNYYIYKRVRTSKNKDFNVPFGEDTERTIFVASDNDGLSYYFAGNPKDNWVEFGGYYWRIIRINGDGSIRLIYQGRTEDESGNELEPQVIGEGTQIGVSAFNKAYNNNKYVGYWYSVNDELRGLDTSSDIYISLNNWFANSNIKQGSIYFDKIDINGGFCGDRTPSSSADMIDGKGGTGTVQTYYGAFVRMLPSEIIPTSSSPAVNPSLNCLNGDDVYTYNIANRGNKKLANPVGLITADELSYAGMAFNSANKITINYLYTGQNYWTLSPYAFTGTAASVCRVSSVGYIGTPWVPDNAGVRPVINLRSDVKFTGDGTISNPYKVTD
ncbi:MAG: hypothetical protein NC483_01975, partial [Ruminococcus sp.]|nr:hypothetical protein [Ruminococcus sp.]